MSKKKNIPWNKGLSKMTDKRIKGGWSKGLTKETSPCIMEFSKKHSVTKKKLFISGKLKIWNKGIPRTEEEKIKISATRKERIALGYIKNFWTNADKHRIDEAREKLRLKRLGANNPFYGKKHNSETIKELSEKLKGKNKGPENWMFGKRPVNAFPAGESHPFFNNWSSKEPYGIEFYKKRNDILERDEVCCLCFGGENIVVHHINYNKHDNRGDNLVGLCNRCHSKTNVNRVLWERFFMSRFNFINEVRKFGGIGK